VEAKIHQVHFDLSFYFCFSQRHTAILHVLLKKVQIHKQDIFQIFLIPLLAFHL